MEGRLALPEVRRVMQDLLRGLQYSHGRGVVHRDVKPGNLILTTENEVKIADFGIARIEASELTQAGTVMGTPAYMAPEQLMGQPIDGRADLYAAGVILYQLLTGERPFTGSLTAIMHKALHTEPPPPSALSVSAGPELDRVVARAMAKRPADRFPSADAFLTDLLPALDAVPAPGTPPIAADVDATRVFPATPAGAAPAPVPAFVPPSASASAAVPADGTAVVRPVPAVAARTGGRRAGLLGAVALVALLAAGGGAFLLLSPARTPSGPDGSGAGGRASGGSGAASSGPGASGTAGGAASDGVASGRAASAGSEGAAPTGSASPTAASPPAGSSAAPSAEASRGAASADATASAVRPSSDQASGGQPSTAQSSPAQPSPAQASATQAPAAQPSVAAPADASAARGAAAGATGASPSVAAVPVPFAPPAPAPTPAPTRQAMLAVPDDASATRALRAALRAAPCSLAHGAVVDASARVAGLVGQGGPEASLHAAVAAALPGREVAWALDRFDGPYCAALDVLRPLDDGAASGPELHLADDRARLGPDDFIRVRLRMPAFAGTVRLDYLSHDGSVLHMAPVTGRDPTLAAGAEARFGDPRPGFNGWQVGPPYGTDMILAVSSAQPLFTAARPEVEAAGPYLAALERALAAARARGGAASASALLVNTAATP